MTLPDNIPDLLKLLTERDPYYDLKSLSAYSSLRVSTLRDHIRSEGLPCFKVKGKILVKQSEFDKWIENYRDNKNRDLKDLVDGVMNRLKGE